jgi:hypothetical protein
MDKLTKSFHKLPARLRRAKESIACTFEPHRTGLSLRELSDSHSQLPSTLITVSRAVPYQDALKLTFKVLQVTTRSTRGNRTQPELRSAPRIALDRSLGCSLVTM